MAMTTGHEQFTDYESPLFFANAAVFKEPVRRSRCGRARRGAQSRNRTLRVVGLLVKHGGVGALRDDLRRPLSGG